MSHEMCSLISVQRWKPDHTDGEKQTRRCNIYHGFVPSWFSDLFPWCHVVLSLQSLNGTDWRIGATYCYYLTGLFRLRPQEWIETRFFVKFCGTWWLFVWQLSEHTVKLACRNIFTMSSNFRKNLWCKSHNVILLLECVHFLTSDWSTRFRITVFRTSSWRWQEASLLMESTGVELWLSSIWPID